MLILVTNDDGVHSPGLRSLASAMQSLGQVVVVAPDRNRSAVGHALTLDHPLRVEQLETALFAVDGTPTDCVNLGIHGLLRERPDLVVSGINRGSNLGDDITYSGTVSAALEASLMGFPALAISLDVDQFNATDLERAGSFARQLATRILEQGVPQGTFLNVNVPSGPSRGVRITRQGRRRYSEGVVQNRDPRGRTYYWIGGGDVGFEDIPGSDCNALREGMISVTPLRFDLTHEPSCKRLAEWSLTGDPENP